MATITENEATLIKAGVPKEAAAAVMVKSETIIRLAIFLCNTRTAGAFYFRKISKLLICN